MIGVHHAPALAEEVELRMRGADPVCVLQHGEGVAVATHRGADLVDGQRVRRQRGQVALRDEDADELAHDAVHRNPGRVVLTLLQRAVNLLHLGRPLARVVRQQPPAVDLVHPLPPRPIPDLPDRPLHDAG